MVEIYSIDQIRESFKHIRSGKPQPYEEAIARLAKDYGNFTDLSEKDIIEIYRICQEVDRILRNQFNNRDTEDSQLEQTANSYPVQKAQ